MDAHRQNTTRPTSIAGANINNSTCEFYFDVRVRRPKKGNIHSTYAAAGF